MPRHAPNINYLWAKVIVEELVRWGVDTFCISPGSRSAPLALAAAENEGANCTVHFDERGTAFYALGRAKSTRRPAAFICTSGTAVANALPAVVEASMARVPLIVLSADRPPELQDAGANQTIHQPGIFGHYARWAHTFACPDEKVPLASVLTAVDQAVARAVGPAAGPVHLNCMFREPLAPSSEEYSPSLLEGVEAWLDSGRPYTTYTHTVLHADAKGLGEIDGILGKTSRGLLVFGQLDSSEDRQAALTLAKHLDWPVLADIASGLRAEVEGVRGIHWYDRILLGRDAPLFGDAQTLLHMGGAVISKRLNAYLASRGARSYIRVAEHRLRHDPGHAVSLRITSTLSAFAHQIISTAKPQEPDSEWVDKLGDASTRAGESLASTFDSDDTLNEIAVARSVTKLVPTGSVLFLGNSLPIRDADTYGFPAEGPRMVAANRGASGIDGNIATAAGYAAGLEKPVTAVLGDLAVLHDLNSLALLHDSKQPVILIAINNDGGGIFSLLPIAQHGSNFEDVFGTPHGLSFEHAAELFGLSYYAPASIAEFESTYGTSLDAGASCVIEIAGDRQANAALHKRLDQAQNSQ